MRTGEIQDGGVGGWCGQVSVVGVVSSTLHSFSTNSKTHISQKSTLKCINSVHKVNCLSFGKRDIMTVVVTVC